MLLYKINSSLRKCLSLLNPKFPSNIIIYIIGFKSNCIE